MAQVEKEQEDSPRHSRGAAQSDREIARGMDVPDGQLG